MPAKGPVVIAPFVGLHLLPFDISIDTAGNYLAEQYSITYIPSLSVLNSLFIQQKQIQKEKIGESLLTIVYSAPESKFPLPHVVEEAMLVKQFFAGASHSVYLEQENALPDVIIRTCNEKAFDVIHIACHGNFDMNDPKNSGLLLSNGSILSVERIQTELRLNNKPLVILSACETGRITPERADENLGLVQSFLAAGAGGVVSSLWAVNDESTRALFTAFYKSRNERVSDAETLRQAMLSVKSKREMQKPFFWGAFHYTGLPLKL